MKRTLGAVMMVTGILLALVSVGPLSWGLGCVAGAFLTVGGASLTRNPEAWI